VTPRPNSPWPGFVSIFEGPLSVLGSPRRAFSGHGTATGPRAAPRRGRAGHTYLRLYFSSFQKRP